MPAAALSRVPAAAALAMAVVVVGATRLRRLEVTGESMRPALVPGDRVVVWRTRRLRAGQVAAVRDPRRPTRVMVKRVTGVGTAGVVVHGDNAEASTDSRVFGAVPSQLVVGRVVYRYHPASRAGRVETHTAPPHPRPGGDGERR